MKKIQLDFRKITSIEHFHSEMKSIMGFPDFYGANVNALIDCLSSMRYPDEGMSKITLSLTEILLIEVIGLSQSNVVILNNLLVAIENVNNRELSRGRTPSIYMCML
ncbi:barnase inhibitor [Chitinophaga polysaccharea]|uniref:barstar family protein n=1 Tax=Chitinophaga TaxID=79328 RepID=UPI0014553B9D|nr:MULTISPECIES: barstar family protein [Chitinophaga]NLR56919.1 barnase inhibitor [Chitinophaga polysaccharea]NLU93141.1 barnase inhibitor [Chitinophaga sp. Ak27]